MPDEALTQSEGASYNGQPSRGLCGRWWGTGSGPFNETGGKGRQVYEASSNSEWGASAGAQGDRMRITKIAKFEFEDGSDLEFVPAEGGYEVWLDGVLIEQMARGVRPSEARALYYHDVFGGQIAEESGVTLIPAPLQAEAESVIAVA